jgi:hypothetical protein
MRTRKSSKTALALAAAGSLVLSAAMARAADISVSSTTIMPDAEGSVSVSLNVETGETAVGTLADVGFEAGAAVPPRSGVVAVLAEDITATDTAIPVGDAGDLQSFGTVQIDDELIAYGRKDGNTLVAGGCTGGDSGTACIDSSECTGGGTCEPSGRGQVPPGTVCPGATGCPAAHTMNTGVETPTTPECRMSAALDTLNKDAVFSYLPAACTPGTDCDTVRGIVIALDNLNPFPEGVTQLYTCTIAAGPDEGTFPLTCADGQVSDSPDGEGLIQDGPCNDGEVMVSTELPTCPGDCNQDGQVRSNEAVIIFNIAIENPQVPASSCPGGPDVNGNGQVQSNDAVIAFNIATEVLDCDLQPVP